MTVEEYGHFFETLNRYTTKDAFTTIFSDNVYFQDPFHKTYGIDALFEIFQKMYRTFHKAEFTILESVQKGANGYIRWEFHYMLKKDGKHEKFEGMSHVVFDDHDRVISHIDFWDAGTHIYEKIPLLGMLIRFVKKRIGNG